MWLVIFFCTATSVTSWWITHTSNPGYIPLIKWRPGQAKEQGPHKVDVHVDDQYAGRIVWCVVWCGGVVWCVVMGMQCTRVAHVTYDVDHFLV
jgi:hypothetical protein